MLATRHVDRMARRRPLRRDRDLGRTFTDPRVAAAPDVGNSVPVDAVQSDDPSPSTRLLGIGIMLVLLVSEAVWIGGILWVFARLL